MAGFVPRDKMSKKARKELNRQRRKTWEFSPVTRIADNRKLYNRKKKAHDRYEDYGMGSFFVAEGSRKRYNGNRRNKFIYTGGIAMSGTVKRIQCMALCMAVLLAALAPVCGGFAEGLPEEERTVDYWVLISDLSAAREAVNLIDEDLAALEEDELAVFIAEKWRELFMDSGYRVYVHGKDSPAELQITGSHAFVVLGYELKDGGMTEELKERCEAAAAAWREFPDSILVCSGGATGDNNPEMHTEAGLMKQYLSENCGIPEDSIYIDERAMTTLDNAMNTFAILKEQWIEEITLVTSTYHQRWANLLYAVLAEYVRETEGRTIGMVGNFSCERNAPDGLAGRESRIAAMQLQEMMQRLYPDP